MTDKSLHSWQETRLWSEVLRRTKSRDAAARSQANDARRLLETLLPGIEAVLSQGGTSPLDFTLHDAQHSFRVAERIQEITPTDVLPRLHSYEVGLLLLAAYLHDIGMTPKRRKVVQHHQYLLSGSIGDLSTQEVGEFQAWLDDEGEGIVPPLAEGEPTPTLLRKVDEITTYYCRFRHNDWSEEWIRSNIAVRSLGTYVAWRDDLIVLCRSHHDGYTELLESRFDAKLVGNPGKPINLRYLAMLLRAADVLEFDPERTPDVILRHREVADRSLIFWWKDHEISFALDHNRVLISARPSNAQTHRAVEQTIEQVEAELRTCKALADGVNFQKCAGLTSPTPHRWELSPTVFKDVQPRENRYEYIDGSFRPDTKKLLGLLSGTELYGEKLVAVRELLQNAFDAVREQIAYERLAQPNPLDATIDVTLQNLHRVDLRVEHGDGEVVLVCTDSGIGMSKAIIRDHLLVSGSSRRHDVLELERRCRSRGFSTGRTGQFGIGVLSYFMLASRVTVRTKRSQESGDAEETGWVFETEGVGSFGELRSEDIRRHGTETSLTLRPDVIGDSAEEWYEQLIQYIKLSVVRVPCNFSLTSSIQNSQAILIKPGWSWSEELVRQSVTSRLREPNYYHRPDTPHDLLPTKKKKEIEMRSQDWQVAVSDFKSAHRVRVVEGDLPDGRGTFRIHLSYFDLPGGRSLRFLRLKGNTVLRIYKGFSLRPSMPVRIAWNGMYTDALLPGRHDYGFWHGPGRDHSSDVALIEIDFTDQRAGSISVSRNAFSLANAGQESVAWAIQRAKEIASNFATENADSDYAWLNKVTVGPENFYPSKISWLVADYGYGDNTLRWGECSFPLTSAGALPYSWSWNARSGIFWKDQQVSVLPCVGEPNDDDPYDGQPWNTASTWPDRIMLLRGFWYFPFIVPIWLQKPKHQSTDPIARPCCAFPLNWRHLSSVQLQMKTTSHVTLWNRDHPIFRLATTRALEWCRTNLGQNLDPLEVKQELLASADLAAAWVILCIEREASDLWEGLNDRDPGFLTSLWDGPLPSEGHIEVGESPWIGAVQWVVDGTDSRLRMLSAKGWFTETRETKRFLPDPGPDWTLTIRRRPDNP